MMFIVHNEGKMTSSDVTEEGLKKKKKTNKL